MIRGNGNTRSWLYEVLAIRGIDFTRYRQYEVLGYEVLTVRGAGVRGAGRSPNRQQTTKSNDRALLAKLVCSIISGEYCKKWILEKIFVVTIDVLFQQAQQMLVIFQTIVPSIAVWRWKDELLEYGTKFQSALHSGSTCICRGTRCNEKIEPVKDLPLIFCTASSTCVPQKWELKAVSEFGERFSLWLRHGL